MNTVTGNNKHPRYYFTADEVIFQISHSNRPKERAAFHKNIADEILDDLENFLDGRNKRSVRGGWRGELALPPASRIRTFYSQTSKLRSSQVFSLVPMTLRDTEDRDPEDLSPDRVISLMYSAYADVGNRLTASAESERRSRPQSGVRLRNQSPYRLKAISPNFLSSSLHHGAGTTGPGSIPATRAAPIQDQNPFKQNQFKLRGHHPIERLSAFRMPGANVAILDTAIRLTEIPVEIQMGILKNLKVFLYKDFAPESPDVSLFDDYTEPDPDAEVLHHYNAGDHGPYIASLISSLSPNTKIRLYQAFNNYGVGSFETISDALMAAVNDREVNTPLYINCSFMLEHDLPTAEDLKDADTKEKLEALMEEHTKEKLLAPMKDVFEWATSFPNVLVVAAAGNDGGINHIAHQDPNNPPNPENPLVRADPRFPAAYEKVLSVTALPKGNTRDLVSLEYQNSVYANRAAAEGASEEKMRRSFAIFGGDIAGDKTTTPLGGPLGVYTGIIPEQISDGTFRQKGAKNDSNFAQWAGTSFAVPILVGLLAAKDEDLIIDNPLIPYTEPKAEEKYKDEYGVQVIIVFQGT